MDISDVIDKLNDIRYMVDDCMSSLEGVNDDCDTNDDAVEFYDKYRHLESVLSILPDIDNVGDEMAFVDMVEKFKKERGLN